MNEIERAIELLEEISYNMGLERDTEYAGDAERFHSLCDKKGLIDLATDLCHAELSRQENAPLTCEGCKFIHNKYETHGGVTICCSCSRGTILPDRYEPKGEKE